METKPLVVIVGPTASGKTALAIKLALEFGGEIICADSRTVYKGLDIGTAKPSREDQSLVQHWGLDLVEPNERFTAADFKQYATQKIKEIRSRGRIPFLVGGTGLYVDGIVFDFQFGTKIDEKFRAELEKMTVEELQKYCNEHNVQLPENNKNQRYLIRSIEQNGINNSRKNEPINNLIIVGITTDKKILRSRIEERADNLFSSGVIEEAK
ncbi:MAG: tRNA dimethylallyltransferase, partial [Candidatus Saccharibacteria bacterium]|nr:tRNA dimethylallyltransferase [Candidatus Saccharibacteria bacterium]